jgi:Leucine rich repeat/Leucine Rich repeat
VHQQLVIIKKKLAEMSDEKRRKLASTNSRLLPSINYKQSISLVLLLLVTFTSPSSQSPLTQHGQQELECPRDCECDVTKFSAKCTSVDGLIESYSQKTSAFMLIKTLDLSNNRLTKISNQLELLVNLTELNLSHNKLSQVHKLNFAHLEVLNLSHNRITSAKLAKIPKNVQKLDLSHNEITYLPSDFMKLKELKGLELSGNPLNCSCDTLMIRNWIQYKNMWTDEVIKCASPQIFKGQPWIQARQNEVCIEPVSTSSHRPGSYNWDELEDDNEVMMGDQPADDDEDGGEGDIPNGKDCKKYSNFI